MFSALDGSSRTDARRPRKRIDVNQEPAVATWPNENSNESNVNDIRVCLFIFRIALLELFVHHFDACWRPLRRSTTIDDGSIYLSLSIHILCMTRFPFHPQCNPIQFRKPLNNSLPLANLSNWFFNPLRPC